MSLKARIADLIEAQGPMSVAQFMTISLLDPKDGNVTLLTLQRAAEMLGRKVRLDIV